MTKGCFRCAADNFNKAWITFKLSFKFFKQGISCSLHSTRDKRKYDSLCTKLSSASSNIHGCSPSIHFFNIDKTLPVNIHVQDSNDGILGNTIMEMKHKVKMQSMTPKQKAQHIRTIKWLDELYYYRQVNCEDINEDV